MKIVEQYQCPQCFELYDEKFDAETCCPPLIYTVFAVKNGEYWDSEAEAKEHFYLRALQDGMPPLEAREKVEAFEVIYAE